MTAWAVLPVKPLCRGKSRLHGCLCEDEITLLNRTLFEETFHKLQGCGPIGRILVVSQDEEVLEFTRKNGGVALKENPKSSLNAAVTQALQYISEEGSGRVLILPIDLPLITSADLEELFQIKCSERCIVIVPDEIQWGTNALLLSHADMLKPQFGRHSFQKHTKQATVNGTELIVWLNSNIQRDLDTPQDLLIYNKINLNPIQTMKE